MENEIKEVGVIGLGLMGSSIVAAMMMYGYKVIALGPLDADIEQGPGRIMHALNESRNQGFIIMMLQTWNQGLFIRAIMPICTTAFNSRMRNGESRD